MALRNYYDPSTKRKVSSFRNSFTEAHFGSHGALGYVPASTLPYDTEYRTGADSRWKGIEPFIWTHGDDLDQWSKEGKITARQAWAGRWDQNEVLEDPALAKKLSQGSIKERKREETVATLPQTTRAAGVRAEQARIGRRASEILAAAPVKPYKKQTPSGETKTTVGSKKSAKSSKSSYRAASVLQPTGGAREVLG